MTIRISDTSDPAQVNEDARLRIYFYRSVVREAECSGSQIVQPIHLDPEAIDFLSSAAPIAYELPEFQDSGTVRLQQIPGFEHETCGQITYYKINSVA